MSQNNFIMHCCARCKKILESNLVTLSVIACTSNSLLGSITSALLLNVYFNSLINAHIAILFKCCCCAVWDNHHNLSFPGTIFTVAIEVTNTPNHQGAAATSVPASKLTGHLGQTVRFVSRGLHDYICQTQVSFIYIRNITITTMKSELTLPELSCATMRSEDNITQTGTGCICLLSSAAVHYYHLRQKE